MTTLVRFPMLVAVAMSLANAGAAQNERRPDIIVFFTDDQGYNDVGCFGSPNIDKMAAEAAAIQPTSRSRL